MLRGAADDARAGNGRVVLVEGEPGIGKTRLTSELVHELLTGGELAYGVASELLRDLAHRFGDDRLRDLLSAHATALAPLHPPLYPRPSDRSAPDPAPVDRASIFAAFHSLLLGLSQDRLLCVSVDDLQWVDASSLDLLSYPGPVENLTGERAGPLDVTGQEGVDGGGRQPIRPDRRVAGEQCRSLECGRRGGMALPSTAAVRDAYQIGRELIVGCGARVKAREHLTRARDAFVAMDLTAWATRAADEFAATGANPRRRELQATEPLTSQETRMALHAAKGLSNREIAAALFLSPKTIERHLSSVYRKRGFRSRTELAASFRAPEID